MKKTLTPKPQAYPKPKEGLFLPERKLVNQNGRKSYPIEKENIYLTPPT